MPSAPQLKIAVLVRTNELVGQVMFELQRRGILASEEGGNPLTNSAAVQLILSLLTLGRSPAGFRRSVSFGELALGRPVGACETIATMPRRRR